MDERHKVIVPGAATKKLAREMSTHTLGFMDEHQLAKMLAIVQDYDPDFGLELSRQFDRYILHPK